MKQIQDLASELLNTAATMQGALDHANQKIAELTKLTSELRTNLKTKEKAISNREQRIATLQGNIAYYREHTLRYQKDLAEARSMLRKTKH